jgi:thiamine-phosphate pyrophosphorylase
MHLIVISPPENLPEEVNLLTLLFEAGLERFHIRKPDFSEKEITNYILSIPKKYYSKLVLHSFHHLAERYSLGGIHGKSVKNSKPLSRSFSAHSFSEVQELSANYDYIFLSPVYDSISKEGYRSKFEKEELQFFLTDYHSKSSGKASVIALGGINQQNIAETANMGFDGAAVLGAVWEIPKNGLKNFLMIKEKLAMLQL